MTETFRFFDLHAYTEAEFAEVTSRLRRDGVLSDRGNRLQVGFSGGFATVDTGEAFVQGFWYKNDASLNLPITANSSGTARVDLVVLKLDRTGNTLTAAIHQGVVGGGTPAPTQVVGGTWELVLATVSTVSSVSTVTDARTYAYTVADGNEVNAPLETVTTPVNQQLMVNPTTKLLQWAVPAPSAENGLENSSFRINQRGLGVVTAAGSKLADLWTYSTAGGLAQAGRTAGGVFPAPYSYYVPWSMIIQRTNSNAITSGLYEGMYQVLEGNKWGRFHAQPLVFSGIFYSSKVTNFCYGLRNYAGTRSFYHVFNIPVAGVWTFLWCRIPPDLTGTWVADGTSAAAINGVWPIANTLQGGTADIWNNGNFIAPSGFTSGLTATNDIFYINSPKLEIGYYPTRYMLPDIQDEERAALRQFYRLVNVSYQNATTVDGSANAWVTYQTWFPVPMRVAPGPSNITWNIWPSRNPAAAETGWSVWSHSVNQFSSEVLFIKGSGGAANRWLTYAEDFSAELS